MAAKNNETPYKMNNLDPEVSKKLLSLFTGQKIGYAAFGPSKYILPKKFSEVAEDIYNLKIRPDDIFVATFPRCGTTWTQELVWLIQNDLDYETAKSVDLVNRWAFLEYDAFIDSATIAQYREENKNNSTILQTYDKYVKSRVSQVDEAPSPRFIKTHLALSLLPPNLVAEAKVVYVVRDPRDVAVSFYHHNRLIRNHNFVGDFKTYWDLFRKDLIMFTPYFPHLKEAWAKRNHPNMLFLSYEDMVKDLPAAIRKVAKFLNKKLNDEQIEVLAKHLKFDNFKNNMSVNYERYGEMGILNKGEQPFIRKGKSGGWRDDFDQEMTAQAQEWIKQNLKDTDIKLSFIDN